MKKALIKIYSAYLRIVRTIQNDILLAGKRPSIEEQSVTIRKIKEEHYSLSRFGDGEFSLICGQELKFQPYHEKLSAELKDILQLPPEEKEMLVGIPDVFAGTSQFTLNAEKYWKEYLRNNRARIYKLLRFDRSYSDSLISRFYIDYRDKIPMNEKIARLRSVWDNKRVLIVEGEKSRLGMGNDLFDNTADIGRIVCPSVNAYSCIDEIEQAILDLDSFELILIALGPTATVLAYRLHSKGRQALDIGHIDIEYEWYKKGAEEKTPVPNKYIGEMPGGDMVEDGVDERYKKQIIRRIG